ncbi:hypothetical protein CTA2_2085 [Colletotrichum tanaceti]|uniref:Uncharacterized protein n=1 Tax=Colletotrichum tanaceti TaxID=1306861 RepID=A0A4U6XPI0_9PEZI|nr:hypothetical protein CTA2_2085 [Colletotrichum tanaceti]TKW57705.1 hypothetical protein CTA1_11531 [Colletotrichum tanaceti]
MSSDSDTVCSYKELLNSENDCRVEDQEPGVAAASRPSACRTIWLHLAVATGWVVTTLICTAVALASRHNTEKLDSLNSLVQQSLVIDSDLLRYANEHRYQPLPQPPNALGQTATVDGLQVPGYELKYNATYCDESAANPSDAPSHGCVLDRVQGGWVPEVCSDRELREAWDAMPDFGWWLDEARTQNISQERVYRAGPDVAGRSVYTGVNYHLHHCVAVMRLRNKNSLRRDRGLTYHMLSHHHIEHCFDRFLDWLTPEGINITKKPTEIRFSSAGVVDNKDERTAECYVPV